MRAAVIENESTSADQSESSIRQRCGRNVIQTVFVFIAGVMICHLRRLLTQPHKQAELTNISYIKFTVNTAFTVFSS